VSHACHANGFTIVYYDDCMTTSGSTGLSA
jgi:hypothetical protein